MLKKTLFRTAIAVSCLMLMSVIASADTKIKSRQTSGGQTYENTSYIKGKRQRSETNNGQMIMIQQCDLRRNIQIMPQAKVYMIQPYDEPATSSAASTTGAHSPTTATRKGGVVTSTVTTKDTGERKQMLGYTARRIITTMEMESSPTPALQSIPRCRSTAGTSTPLLLSIATATAPTQVTDLKRVVAVRIVMRRSRSVPRAKVIPSGKR